MRVRLFFPITLIDRIQWYLERTTFISFSGSIYCFLINDEEIVVSTPQRAVPRLPLSPSRDPEYRSRTTRRTG